MIGEVKAEPLVRKALVSAYSNYILIAVVALSILYVCFSPRFNYYFYRPMLFHPWKLDSEELVAPPLAGVVGENVFFPSENGKMLNGWYYKKPGARYTVLFNHGNGGNVSVRTDLVELLLQAGASVLIYDYEGYGESAGMPTVEGICQDGAGAYKFLATTCGVAPERIVLYGESLGVAVAANISSRFSCRGMIFQSGFSSLHSIACEVFPLLYIYPPFMFPSPALDTLSIVKRAHPPLLVVHGDLDRVVPARHGRMIYEAAIGTKDMLELPDTGHSDIYHTASGLFVEKVRSFLASLS